MSQGGKVCRLPWCRQTGPHLTFKNFPDNEIRQMQWLTLLDVAETWKDVPPDKIRQYIICSSHFDTRGNLLRATSTPLVSTVHVTSPTPAPEILEPLTNEQDSDHEPRRKPAASKKPKIQKNMDSNNQTPKRKSPTSAQKAPKNSQNSTPPDHQAEKSRKPAYAPLPTGPATRESFSLAKKIEIVRMLESGLKQADVCKLFNIPKSTVWCIWKSREKIEQAFMSNGPERKKLRRSNFEEVDQALFKWYNSVTSQNVTVTGRLLQTMAESFAQDLGQTNFVCTAGWLERFKQRYCIVLSAHKRKKQEAQARLQVMPENSDSRSAASPSPSTLSSSSETESQDDQKIPMCVTESSDTTEISSKLPSAPPETKSFPNSVQATDWIRHTFPKLLKVSENAAYNPQDIFALEETGILYRLSPELASKITKNRLDTPFDVSQERLTVLICTNSTGTEKRRLLVIGQRKNPPCIASIVGADYSKLPADYESDASGWLTKRIFGQWLSNWDEELKRGKRRVLLLLNSTPVHDDVVNQSKLTQIRVGIIPNNITHVVNPIQEGILNELKWRYRRIQLERMAFYLEQSKEPVVSLYDAVCMLSTAWNEVKEDGIARSFEYVGLTPKVSKGPGPAGFKNLDVSQVLQRATQTGLKVPNDWNFTDFIKVDDSLCAVEGSEGYLNQPPTLASSDFAEFLQNSTPNDPAPPLQRHPMSSLSLSEIQMYLDVIKIWAMNQNSVPQQVHEALSTVESFAYRHDD